jgi:hypothetical protein
MMKNLMVLGSLTQSMELDEVLDVGDVMPFLGEDTVMMIGDGHPLLGTRRIFHQSPRTPTHCSWGWGDAGV